MFDISEHQEKSKIINYIENGSPIRELFASTALGLYSHFMLTDENATREAMKGGGISSDAWIQAAKDFKEAMHISSNNYKMN